MNQELCQDLHRAALQAARIFSNPERAKNRTGEIFTLQDEYPLSDTTAAVIYLKNTEKEAAAFFYHLRTGTLPRGRWEYWFPTDAHILGMQNFALYKQIAETRNYPKNFLEKMRSEPAWGRNG